MNIEERSELVGFGIIILIPLLLLAYAYNFNGLTSEIRVATFGLSIITVFYVALFALKHYKTEKEDKIE